VHSRRVALCLATLVLGACSTTRATHFLHAWLEGMDVGIGVPGTRDTAIVTVGHRAVVVLGRVSQVDDVGEIRPQVVQQGHLVLLQLTSEPGGTNFAGYRTYRVSLSLPPGHYTLEVQHGWVGINPIPRLTYRCRYSITIPQ